ncbi:MAG: DUF881 domain-containing protein [Chloroflexota bacterium]|nr:DUF881 domain-containing protein [Chloroflexota bacterium]
MATADPSVLDAPSPRTRGLRQVRISLALALGIVGFVGAAQWNSQVTRSEFTSSAQQVLAAQVLELEQEQQQLRAEIAQREAEIASFQERGGESQSALDRLNERLAATRLAAGLTEVHGAGVVIAISDSNRVVPEGANPADFIVQAEDLRDIVTALWASGAEAVSVNGQRLVSTTSIYGVGSSILVNTAFLSPPFNIAAIGPGDLRARFESHPAFLGRAARRIESFELEFASASLEDVRIPAFVGNTRFRWAIPVASASP